MKPYTYIYKKNRLKYYQSGRAPKLLIVSGFHGDEADVIRSLIKILKANIHRLPPFLFVPAASPTAVSLGTRKNKNHADINRCYIPDSQEEEAQTLMRFLKKRRFDKVYSFHEDPEKKSFYLYDMGHAVHATDMRMVKKRLTPLRVKLFTGIDDPKDPALGVRIKDGYVGENGIRAARHGFFNGFLAAQKITTQHVNPEIPGAVSIKTKAEVTAAIFETLLFR